MDLTSRDGDWFLDELSSMSGNVSMFLDTLKNNTMVSAELSTISGCKRRIMVDNVTYTMC